MRTAKLGINGIKNVPKVKTPIPVLTPINPLPRSGIVLPRPWGLGTPGSLRFTSEVPFEVHCHNESNSCTLEKVRATSL